MKPRVELLVSAALALILILSGCGGTAFTPIPTPTPTPTLTPTPITQAAKAPMGAFIEESGNQRNFYTATNDGSGLTKVNAQPRDFHSVYVLPDGSKAVFSAHAADGYSQIYYLSPVDSTVEPVQLTTNPMHKISAMLSADGSKIAFLQFDPDHQKGDYPTWDVAVMDASGNNLHVIQPPPGSCFAHPSFSPDASKIVLAWAVGAFGADWPIYTMNADGTDLTRLTPDRLPGEAPAFSPDGNQIVFGSTAWGDDSIYIMNRDGSGLKRVGPQDSKWRDPLFVGDRIMFVRNISNSDEIYSVKVDGSDIQRVTNNSDNDAFEMSY